MKPAPPLGRVYGRKSARRLSATAQATLARAQARVGAQWLAQAEPGGADARALGMPQARATWLEAGFGAGEALLARAQAEPDTLFVGCEVWRSGVAAFARACEAQGLRNARLFEGDARVALRAMGAGSLTGVAALFPDPWPKARHAARRLTGMDFMREAARALKVGGVLVAATDDETLAAWTLKCAAYATRGRLAFCARAAADWRARPADWPVSRYEAKAARRGRDVVWLRFVRVAPRAPVC